MKRKIHVFVWHNGERTIVTFDREGIEPRRYSPRDHLVEKVNDAVSRTKLPSYLGPMGGPHPGYVVVFRKPVEV